MQKRMFVIGGAGFVLGSASTVIIPVALITRKIGKDKIKIRRATVNIRAFRYFMESVTEDPEAMRVLNTYLYEALIKSSMEQLDIDLDEVLRDQS